MFLRSYLGGGTATYGLAGGRGLCGHRRMSPIPYFAYLAFSSFPLAFPFLLAMEVILYPEPRAATCSPFTILMRLHVILRKLLHKYPAQLFSATKITFLVHLHCPILCDSGPSDDID